MGGIDMEYWLDTSETIADGLGFSHFDGLHLTWLLIGVVFIAALCVYYRRQDRPRRDRLRRIVAGAVVADEVFKMAMLFIGGRYDASYLPLHLCSVNIILIAVHALRPGVTLDNYLYTVGIPGALAALLFPSWTGLPLINFMHLHSFTLHILLVAYPVMLLSGGDLKPGWRHIPRCIGLLALLAMAALAVNLMLDTNFMFLMSANKGNPLYIFRQLFGDHRVGFAVLIPAILLVMYTPLELIRKLRNQ
jgi:hypothetical integral membrane protein (TIGR02206 family)